MENLNQEVWEAWVKTRPPIIQELCKRFPPNKLYLLKASNHKVTIHSYCEDETLTVNVTGEYNLVVFDRKVFGIRPEDLEVCERSLPDVPVGAVLTDPEDVQNFINEVKDNKNGH